MAAQPSEDDVNQMMMIGSILRQEAISRLKGNNNDVNQAMNEMFDNPGNNRYLDPVWDDSQFASERDGSNSYGALSFQVQGPDDHGLTQFLAPSRPPSRATSPMQPVISLADEHARANPESRMTEAELSDANLQKALMQSAQEAGLPPQQYGVTGIDSVHFGPSNRPESETNQWQMIHIGNSTSSQDPEPADRQREPGTPAFLKQSAQGHRLASLLSIYHEIPLAREVFLDREDLLSDFGHNKEWWAGKSIDRTRAVQIQAGGSPPAVKSNTHTKGLLHELQRLMAFLDETHRSYGSVDPLTSLPSVKRAEGNDFETKFFEAWRKSRHGSQDFWAIFTSAIQPRESEPDDETEVESESQEFAILDLEIPIIDDFEEVESLYDLADKLLWNLSGLDLANSAYLNHLGEIISFRITAPPSSKSIQIPEIWYPDRYLEFGRSAALEMRKQKASFREKIMKILSLENKLEYFSLPGGRVVKVKDIFGASLMHDAEPISEDGSSTVNFSPTNILDTEMTSELRVGDKIDVSAELCKIMSSVDAKLTALNVEKEKARASLHELSKLYTEPTINPGGLVLNPYKLCGVSTKSGVTYLRRLAELDLIDMDLDENEGGSGGDQWWKLAYIATESKPVSVMKVKIEKVLEAAMEGANSPILVYASEKALSEPALPLPDALDTFVRADNLAFKGEFPSSALGNSSNDSFSPKSPPKRKFDDSDDSQENVTRYTSDESRWGGMSPIREDKQILVSHREISSPDENEITWGPTSASESGGDSITPRGSELHDVIMGQDPNELVDVNDATLVPSGTQPGQEMQEKRPMTTFAMAMEEPRRKSSLTMDVDDILGT